MKLKPGAITSNPMICSGCDFPTFLRIANFLCCFGWDKVVIIPYVKSSGETPPFTQKKQ